MKKEKGENKRKRRVQRIIRKKKGEEKKNVKKRRRRRKKQKDKMKVKKKKNNMNFLMFIERLILWRMSFVFFSITRRYLNFSTFSKLKFPNIIF